MPLQADLDATVTPTTVEFVFAVDNTGADSVELRFRSGQAADLIVVRDDEVVWRWSEGRMFTQALWTETVPPGDPLVNELTWDHPVQGTFEAVATLEATNVDVEAKTRFEV